MVAITKKHRRRCCIHPLLCCFRSGFPRYHYEDYSLFHLEKEHLKLKIEIQNYFPKRTGNVHTLENGIKIDNLQNILINKITTFCNRNEAKDLFDILAVSRKYSFDWEQILRESSIRQLATDEYSGTQKNIYSSISNFDTSKLLKYLESDFFVCYENDFNEILSDLEIIKEDIKHLNKNSLSWEIEIKDALPLLQKVDFTKDLSYLSQIVADCENHQRNPQKEDESEEDTRNKPNIRRDR